MSEQDCWQQRQKESLMSALMNSYKNCGSQPANSYRPSNSKTYIGYELKPWAYLTANNLLEQLYGWAK